MFCSCLTLHCVVVAAQDERPTQVLWVGLPGGTKVTDVELYNAFLPCGGLERVKSFSERNYAFVQFSSIEAASHAKTVMQVCRRTLLVRSGDVLALPTYLRSGPFRWRGALDAQVLEQHRRRWQRGPEICRVRAPPELLCLVTSAR
jgi:hypothetical protein